MVGRNRGDQLSFEEVDDKRGTLHTDRRADVCRLHGRWRQERYDLFLRRIGGKCRRREREFSASKCEAGCGGYCDAWSNRFERHGRRRAGRSAVVLDHGCDELSREESDGERRPVRAGRGALVEWVHRCGGGQRDDILLCCFCNDRQGGKRQFGAGQREADSSDGFYIDHDLWIDRKPAPKFLWVEYQPN